MEQDDICYCDSPGCEEIFGVDVWHCYHCGNHPPDYANVCKECNSIKPIEEEYQFHEVSEIFPMMSYVEFGELKSDIKLNGLREPIYLYKEDIIDGRNRYLACKEVGVEPVFREWDGKGDLVSFVVSLNLHRRHLNESQRAMVATKIANLKQGDNRFTLDPQICGSTQHEAAKLLNISQRSIQHATKVLESGVPELSERVMAGGVAVSTASDIATLPKEHQIEIVARGEKEILAASKEIRKKKAEKRRAERFEKIAEISNQDPLLPKTKFPIILCDPPWQYEHIETESRAIENQYPTMTLQEICEMSISDIAMDDCLIFMWATSPKLKEAMEVLDAWGFDYRTNFVWVKDKIGMGYYGRQKHELLLIAKKGDIPAPAPENRRASVIEAVRGKHSVKPDEFYTLIDTMYPTLPKIEIFARIEREGWYSWGNQVNE